MTQDKTLYYPITHEGGVWQPTKDLSEAQVKVARSSVPHHVASIMSITFTGVLKEPTRTQFYPVWYRQWRELEIAKSRIPEDCGAVVKDSLTPIDIKEQPHDPE